MMRKTILILAVLLLTTVNIEAQNRKRPHRTRLTQTERLDMRAEKLTGVMVSTYKLNDTQQKSLLELNKKWLSNSTNSGTNKKNVRNKRADYRGRSRGVDSLYLENPTLHREARIQELSSQVDQYKGELKKIMTSSQFKAYEKRSREGVAQLSK